MRKFYSIVLMAAALLVGTNVWAVSNADELQDAIDALRGTSGTVTVTTSFSLTEPIWIGPADGSEAGAAPNVTLDLGGNVLSYAGATDEEVYLFVLGKGTLRIKNGSILLTGAINKSSNVFTVYGTYTKTANYSNLIIDADAEVTASNGSVIAVMEKAIKNGKYKGAYGRVFANPSQKGFVTNYSDASYGFAFGANVDVYGTLTSSGSPTKTYGIKTNGLLACPKDGMTKRGYSASNPYEAWLASVTIDASWKAYVPNVHIWPSAVITTDANIMESAAVYASGYANWIVEGKCTGNIGASISSGTVEFKGAEISSNSAHEYASPSGENSVSGYGSGVIINSRNQNAGGVEVTVADSKISGTTGYAIEERVNASTPKVESVTIESGEIKCGADGKGAVVATSADKTTIYGGEVTGSINVIGGSISDLLPAANKDQENLYTYDSDTKTYTFNAAFHVTLNANGLATFSAGNPVQLPTGLVAYIATGMDTYLNVGSPIAGASSVIPENQGYILYGQPNAEFTLYAKTNGSPVGVDANLLQPSSAWTENLANVYILHGSELWLYTGTEFKSNKAFLQWTAAGAPERIRLVFAEEEEATAIENVEATVESVKFIENGQLFIRRGENIYNVQGQIVK